jgi:hypothetical protein
MSVRPKSWLQSWAQLIARRKARGEPDPNPFPPPPKDLQALLKENADFERSMLRESRRKR